MSFDLVSTDGQAAYVQWPPKSTTGRCGRLANLLAGHGKNHRRPARATMTGGAGGPARGNGRRLHH